nr:MAG TPA: hypothetical protein [Caudoviricetes sp.]
MGIIVQVFLLYYPVLNGVNAPSASTPSGAQNIRPAE